MPSLVSSTVWKVVVNAWRFFRLNRQNQAASLSYGYFTTHPVAPLNWRRLAAILRTIEDERLEKERALKILDCACGGGIIATAAASMGHTVLGTDLNEGELKLAREFTKTCNVQANFLAADLLNPTDWQPRFEQSLAGKPDAVILAYTLHHLPRVESFVENLGRWLPSGAWLVINEENPQAPLFQLKHALRAKLQKDTETEWHRTYAQWKSLLEKSDFRVGRPLGLDPIPWLGRIAPLRSWSLVFAARKV